MFFWEGTTACCLIRCFRRSSSSLKVEISSCNVPSSVSLVGEVMRSVWGIYETMASSVLVDVSGRFVARSAW